MTDDIKKTDDTSDGKFRIGDLREIIAAEVKSAIGAVKDVTSTDTKAHDDAEKITEAKLDSKSTIASEVEKAIADIKSKEAAAARDQDVDSKLKTLFDRTEERPPVERRKVHRLMGWGE